MLSKDASDLHMNAARYTKIFSKYNGSFLIPCTIFPKTRKIFILFFFMYAVESLNKKGLSIARFVIRPEIASL